MPGIVNSCPSIPGVGFLYPSNISSFQYPVKIHLALINPNLDDFYHKNYRVKGLVLTYTFLNIDLYRGIMDDCGLGNVDKRMEITNVGLISSPKFIRNDLGEYVLTILSWQFPGETDYFAPLHYFAKGTEVKRSSESIRFEHNTPQMFCFQIPLHDHCERMLTQLVGITDVILFKLEFWQTFHQFESGQLLNDMRTNMPDLSVPQPNSPVAMKYTLAASTSSSISSSSLQALKLKMVTPFVKLFGAQPDYNSLKDIVVYIKGIDDIILVQGDRVLRHVIFYEYILPNVQSAQSQAKVDVSPHLATFVELFTNLQAQNSNKVATGEVFPTVEGQATKVVDSTTVVEPVHLDEPSLTTLLVDNESDPSSIPADESTKDISNIEPIKANSESTKPASVSVTNSQGLQPPIDHSNWLNAENQPINAVVTPTVDASEAVVTSSPDGIAQTSLAPQRHHLITRNKAKSVVLPYLSLAARKEKTMRESKSTNKTLKSPHWLTTMQDEINVLYSNKTWILVPKHVGMNLVGSKWYLRLNCRCPSLGHLESGKYDAELVKKTEMTQAKAINTPLAQKHGLYEATGGLVDAFMYRMILGSLQYLTITRPDITHAVNLARYDDLTLLNSLSTFCHQSNRYKERVSVSFGAEIQSSSKIYYELQLANDQGENKSSLQDAKSKLLVSLYMDVAYKQQVDLFMVGLTQWAMGSNSRFQEKRVITETLMDSKIAAMEQRLSERIVQTIQEQWSSLGIGFTKSATHGTESSSAPAIGILTTFTTKYGKSPNQLTGQNYPISEAEKVEVVEFHILAETQLGYHQLKRAKRPMCWEEVQKHYFQLFGPSESDNPVGKLVTLRQTGIVEINQRQFQEKG
ncbi:hypothetical protein FXO37_08769 [Capsicum annuum]|nr:hypothetical protein FXO37_08769 [Capsicum annuum]